MTNLKTDFQSCISAKCRKSYFGFPINFFVAAKNVIRKTFACI